jgi:hypothetical protein
MKQVRALVEDVQPEVTKAFTARAREDMPLYVQSLEKEGDAFKNNLSKQFEKAIQTQGQKAIQHQEGLLKKEFPTIQDEKVHARVVANLQTAFKNLTDRYYVKEFNHELEGLYTTWEKFQPAQPDNNQTDDEMFMSSLLEILRVKLAHPPSTGKP